MINVCLWFKLHFKCFACVVSFIFQINLCVLFLHLLDGKIKTRKINFSRNVHFVRTYWGFEPRSPDFIGPDLNYWAPTSQALRNE